MKNTLFVMCIMALAFGACSAPTPTPLPTGTLLFRDDFENALDEGWQWTRENSQLWSLSSNPGWLEIQAGFGIVNGGNISNLLLRQAPEGDFELETALNFKPTKGSQTAGLLVFQNSANYVQFGRAFCEGASCVGDGYYLDSMSGGSFASENFATQADASTDTIYLRLRSMDGVFTGYISTDRNNWKLIGSTKNAIKPLSVGLLAGGDFDRSTLLPAQFDYFVINSLP